MVGLLELSARGGVLPEALLLDGSGGSSTGIPAGALSPRKSGWGSSDTVACSLWRAPSSSLTLFLSCSASAAVFLQAPVSIDTDCISTNDDILRAFGSG